jgi:glucose dehydrogenase
MARPTAAFLSVLFFTLLSAIATAQPKGPTQAELNTAAANAADWLHPNHDYGGRRFVDIAEINRLNIHSLSPVCRFQVGDLHPFHRNPLVYRGVMYVTTTSPVWRFHTFPTRDEPGSETWSTTEELIAGGAVWTPFAHTGGAISGGMVTYQVGGKQYVAVTSGAATRFWRVPPAAATVVVFSLPKIENSLGLPG